MEVFIVFFTGNAQVDSRYQLIIGRLRYQQSICFPHSKLYNYTIVIVLRDFKQFFTLLSCIFLLVTWSSKVTHFCNQYKAYKFGTTITLHCDQAYDSCCMDIGCLLCRKLVILEAIFGCIRLSMPRNSFVYRYIVRSCIQSFY